MGLTDLVPPQVATTGHGEDDGCVTTISETPRSAEPGRILRAAMFVDFDNVYIGLRRLDPVAAEAFATDPAHWLSELESGSDDDGEFTRRFLIRSCYLNPSVFSQFRPNFTRAGFQVVDCPSLTQQGKSSADINLVLDAVDALAAATRYEEIVIVSADADFTPLALRCRADDRRVTIITASPAASAYRAVADTVITADDLADLVTSTASVLPELTAAPKDEPANKGRGRSGRGRGSSSNSSTVQNATSDESSDQSDTASGQSAKSGRSDQTETSTRGGRGRGSGKNRKATAGDGSTGSTTESDSAADPTPTPAQPEPHEDVFLPFSPARSAVLKRVRAADRPLTLGAVAQIAQKSDPGLPDSNWGGTGGFTAWLAQDVPEVGVSSRPPGHVWDPARFDEADLPGAADDIDPSALQRQVVAVTDVPGLSPQNYRALLTTLADDIATHPFDRPTTARRVRNTCQEAGAPIGRSTVNFVISAILYAGAELSKAPTAAELADAYAQNVVGLCQGARMELGEADIAALRAWVGGGLLDK